jgi:hypothetical protein
MQLKKIPNPFHYGYIFENTGEPWRKTGDFSISRDHNTFFPRRRTQILARVEKSATDQRAGEFPRETH